MGQPRFVPMVMKLYYDDQYLSEWLTQTQISGTTLKV